MIIRPDLIEGYCSEIQHSLANVNIEFDLEDLICRHPGYHFDVVVKVERGMLPTAVNIFSNFSKIFAATTQNSNAANLKTQLNKV